MLPFRPSGRHKTNDICSRADKRTTMLEAALTTPAGAISQHDAPLNTGPARRKTESSGDYGGMYELEQCALSICIRPVLLRMPSHEGAGAEHALCITTSAASHQQAGAAEKMRPRFARVSRGRALPVGGQDAPTGSPPAKGLGSVMMSGEIPRMSAPNRRCAPVHTESRRKSAPPGVHHRARRSAAGIQPWRY